MYDNSSWMSNHNNPYHIKDGNMAIVLVNWTQYYLGMLVIKVNVDIYFFFQVQ